MKRSDLKGGTVFRHHNGSVWYKITHTRFTGLQVWSYEDEECNDRSRFEGFIRETESNKGFAVYQFILRKEVEAFFLFKDFEVLTPSNQS